MSDTGGAKEMVEAKHIAAVLTPEKGRAPVLNKDISLLTERMKKEGGKSVFQAEVGENEENTLVNFDQMRRVMTDEKHRVDAESDPARKAELQKRFDRLNLRVNIYDKLLNNEGYASLSPEERADVTRSMIALPGFCESISLITGGRLSIDQVTKFLQGRGGVAVTPDERRAIGAIVEQFANSDKLHSRIAKSLAGLSLPTEDEINASKIVQLQTEIANEKIIRDTLKANKDIVDSFSGKGPKEVDRIQKQSDRIDKIVNTLQEINKPYHLDSTTLSSIQTSVKGRVDDAQKAYDTKVKGTGSKVGADSEFNALQEAKGQADAIQRLVDIVTANPNIAQEYEDFEDFTAAKAKRETAEKDLLKIEEKKREIATLEAERGTHLSKYKRKMETALPDEMKRFWNDVVITQAVQAANAEMAIKAEKTAGEQTEAQKREQNASAILEKYLKLAYLKYRNGKVVGWDDAAIKQFMHKDLLSQSPKRLTRSQLERVYYRSGEMPPEYRKELKAMLTEMGVGQGTPPLTFRQALEKLPDSWFDAASSKTVPEMLGYAWGRGYYFDRMKLKGAEAEFLRQAYPPEFFEQAIAAREAEFTAAQQMLNDHLLGGDATTKEALKKIFGKDWTQGMKRMMKTTAVAGAIGAGVFLGGGGLVANVWTPGNPFTYGTLKAGLANVGTNLSSMKDAAVQTIALASRASGKAIEGTSSFIAQGANQLINP